MALLAPSGVDIKNCFGWQPFPDTCKLGYLIAPFGPGVYELRNRQTRELILCGQSKNVAFRMTSLLSSDEGGAGRRKNARKQEYVRKFLCDIDYRTEACKDEDESKEIETQLRRRNTYIFPA